MLQDSYFCGASVEDLVKEIKAIWHMKSYSIYRPSGQNIKRKSPANISMSDQHCFNVVNSTSDFQRCTTFIKCRRPTLIQRCPILIQ